MLQFGKIPKSQPLAFMMDEGEDEVKEEVIKEEVVGERVKREELDEDDIF